AENGLLSVCSLFLLQVSKAARQEKKFQDYNERCTFHHQAKVRSISGQNHTVVGGPYLLQRSASEPEWTRKHQNSWRSRCPAGVADQENLCPCHVFLTQDFAVNLENKVSSINEALQMKSLTFVIDACKILAQARKVLAYSCVYSYYNQETEKMDVMEQQTEALDLHTNALQILLGETLQHRPSFETSTTGVQTGLTVFVGFCVQRRLCYSALTWPPVSGC
ncbi:hypothetical protein XENOCAPTIV_022981, partial [Xenoophorus captivus]